MVFSCTPILPSDFPFDPTLGELVHRITKQQCDAIADLVAHMGQQDLDNGSRWALAMVTLGACALFAALRVMK
jgi:hypothetical protein